MHGADPLKLISQLAAKKIEARPLWKPMHLQPLFSDSFNVTNGNSQLLFENGLTLPSGSLMSVEQIELINSSITNFLESKRQNA